jgi:hypothetical protein
LFRSPFFFGAGAGSESDAVVVCVAVVVFGSAADVVVVSVSGCGVVRSFGIGGVGLPIVSVMIGPGVLTIPCVSVRGCG